MDKIIPTKDNILVELDKLPDKTDSGFVLHHSSKKEEMREYTHSPVLYGEVKAVGSEVKDLKQGQRVVFTWANCWQFGEKGVLINEEHVMAIV